MPDSSDHPPLPFAFATLGVRDSVLRGLAEAGFETPSEIQSLVIPPALEGHDILGQARTGTGKTAAFGVPLLCKCVKGFATQALILVPTRELAVQVEAEIAMLAKHTPLRAVACYGGQRIAAQMKKIKSSPEIVVGTPGRVMDLIGRRVLDFANIRFVVLDEVDRMLDIGFREDIKQILSDVGRGRGKRTRVSEFQDERIHPDNRDAAEGEDVPALPDGPLQTMFVSATLGREIESLARRFMREKDVVKLVATHADESPMVEQVEQYLLSVGEPDKAGLLIKLIEQEKPELAIVFMRTKRGAEKLTKRLHAAKVDVREIHGNLNQSKRDSVMKGFRESKFDVLVATDLASRGIDVRGVSHIINYDIPEDPEAYVHRIGRTARMGMQGKAFTFVRPDQGEELTRIEGLINMLIPRGEVAGFEPTELVEARSKPTVTVSEPKTSFVKKAEPSTNGEAVAEDEPTTTRRRRRTMAKVVRRRR